MKPTPKEHIVELKPRRGAVRQQDHVLQRALDGDREALGRLFVSNMPRLYRAALRILGKPQDAEEALQDGFLAALRHLGEFECRSRFSTWLTRIVINVALMRLRRSHREVLTSFDQNCQQDEVDTAATVADPRPNPEEAYERKERLQFLQNTLRKLPAGYKSILWLRDVQAMSTQEVAELLKVKPATVKSTLHRARLRLEMESRVASLALRTFQTSRREPGQLDIGLPPDSWQKLAIEQRDENDRKAQCTAC